ncbi:phosphatidic acid phosphatase type 2/haloperoxidase [Aspergillus cavernicola]|uniref:Phosphatidic acid phosphatase type 2/haloperoxidase n=1 Tax=Aspergillus cavernicola TaxID=176166 RepID=A0ABR4IRR5_9EURO
MARSALSAGSTAPTSPLLGGLAGAVSRVFQQSYPLVDAIGLAFITGCWILIQIFVTPFHRMFALDNQAIQYPFATVERVPVLWSVFYAGAIPLLIIMVWAVMLRPSPHKTQVTILGFLTALMLTSLLTDIIKNAVGRPRPDLISRCMPRKGTPGNTLVQWTVCTQINEHILQEGWRSFPSGHSSFSFAGLGYLSLFFSGQMHVFRPRTDLCRCLLVMVPVICALMVAISRLEDYRHDVYDVTSGTILGSLVAFFCYRRYYPPLRSFRCDTPYSKDDFGPEGFSKIPDDEEQQVSGRRAQSWAGEESYQLEEPTVQDQ